MGRVLDDPDRGGDRRPQSRDVHHLAVEMDGDDRPRPLRHGCRRESEIDEERVRVAVDEDRRRADEAHHVGRRREGHGRYDDLVAGADPHGEEGRHRPLRPARGELGMRHREEIPQQVLHARALGAGRQERTAEDRGHPHGVIGRERMPIERDCHRLPPCLR